MSNSIRPLLSVSRRRFMGFTALGSAGLLAPALARAGIDGFIPGAEELQPMASGAQAVSPPSEAAVPAPADPFVNLARAELSRLGEQIPYRDVVAIADYSLPSNEPRFHLVDPDAGRIVETLLVAHGRGSDPKHSGRLQRFSNEVGSNASSEGAYRTGERYVGIYGRSIRLDGLDPTNDNAELRAIVIHSAPYVSAAVLQSEGKLGRSEGCFAFAEDDYDMVFDRLGPGRLLVAGLF